jgi:hypothetical protein
LKIITVAAAVVVLLPAAGFARQQTTSPETKSRMILLIGQLESDPYAKNGKDIRREVLVWLTDAPDVTVKLCTNVLGEVRKYKGDDGSTLTVQLAFSEAKFILEHPDKAGDVHAVNVAGIDGVLRTYAAMKAAKPKLNIDEAEHLAQLKASGQLDAFIDAGLAKCQ